MIGWYRAMRLPALALAVLGLAACRKGALQEDAGTGGLTLDGGLGVGGPGTADGAVLPDDGPVPTADANCGQISTVATRVAPEILVVLDRSISIDQAQWNNFLSGVIGAISNEGSLIDWGLYAFPEDGPACGAGTLTAAIDVPIQPDNVTHEIAHIAAAGTGASGTPTAAAIQTAAGYMQSLTDQNPKYLMLLTDGAPTCAGTIDALSVDPAQAQADAVAAIAAAYRAGLPTIVVAPSTTTAPADIAALNALSEAGGYSAGSPPGPTFPNEQTLWQLLIPFDGGFSCTFYLGPNAPPVPNVVTVTLNGARVPRDPSHVVGWDYTDSWMNSIELYGYWCDQVAQNRSVTFTAYFGCPGG
jgi:hypothetical protein